MKQPYKYGKKRLSEREIKRMGGVIRYWVFPHNHPEKIMFKRTLQKALQYGLGFPEGAEVGRYMVLGHTEWFMGSWEWHKTLDK